MSEKSKFGRRLGKTARKGCQAADLVDRVNVGREVKVIGSLALRNASTLSSTIASFGTAKLLNGRPTTSILV
jgi:hypothetical protein